MASLLLNKKNTERLSKFNYTRPLAIRWRFFCLLKITLDLFLFISKHGIIWVDNRILTTFWKH
nr:MAG TPA: hypothetical protein [Caudoviricetes sp.]